MKCCELKGENLIVNIQDSEPHLLIFDSEITVVDVSVVQLDHGKVKFPIVENHRYIKASPDRSCLAFDQSSNNLKIINSNSFVCDIQKLSILGFEWISSKELMLLSKTSVDFYSIGHQITLERSISKNIGWYRYCHFSKLLLLSISNNSFSVYSLDSQPNHLAQFSIAVPKLFQVTRNLVQIFHIYNKHFISYLDNTLHLPKLCLYHVSKNKCFRAFVLDLLHPGSFTFNTWDNLLIVHNTSTKLSLIFDLKCPIPNIPVIEPSSKFFDTLDCTANMSGNGADLIQTRDYIFKLTVAIDEIIPLLKFSADKIMEFLLRRRVGVSFSLKCKILQDAIVEKTPIHVIEKMFDLLCSEAVENHRFLNSKTLGNSRQSLKRSSLSDLVLSAAFQEDIVSGLFLALNTSRKRIINSLLNFIRSLSKVTAVETFVYELLVDLMIQEGQHIQLTQLVQCNFIPDSVKLARIFLSVACIHRCHYNTAISMCVRLGNDEMVIDIYLDAGKIMDAIRYAISKDCLKLINPIIFLDNAYTTGDSKVFLNVFRAFEEYGVIPMHHDDDAITKFDSRLAWFVSVFREMWSPELDMETVL